MPQGGVTHDISIEDTSAATPKKGYMLHRQNGRRQWGIADYQTIAPRTLTTEELDAAQLPPEIELSWFQDNWQSGIGGRVHRRDAGRLASGSKVETTVEGTLRLARHLQSTTVDTAPSAYKAAGFARYQNTEVWSFVGDEAYRWNYTDKDWDIQTTSTAVISTGDIVRNGIHYGGIAYAPIWTASTDAPARFMKKASAGDTWAAGGAASDTFKYHEVADDKYFAAHWGSGSEHTLKYTTDPNQATIAWTTETIGQADAVITALVTDGSTLLVCKQNGVWARYADGTDQNLTPEFERMAHPDNFKGAFNWNGHILLPLGSGGMLQLYEGRLEDISLKNYAPDQSHLHGRVCAIGGDATAVFLLVVDTANTKYYLVMGKWLKAQGADDFRWHEVAEVSYTTSTVQDHATLFAEGVPSGSTYHHRVWVGVESGGSNLLPYFYTVSDMDAEDIYTSASDAEAVTVAWDANLAKVDKLFSSVDFTTDNLGSGANDHYFHGRYRVDGGSWTYVTGTQSTSKLTSDTQTLSFGDEVTGKKIELQLLPVRGTTTTTSPELKDFTVRAALRPTAIKSIPLRVYIADGQMLLNGARNVSSKGDYDQLVTWNAQAAEVTVVDPRGTSRDMVFLPGLMKVEEVAAVHKRRPEYIVSFILAEV